MTTTQAAGPAVRSPGVRTHLADRAAARALRLPPARNRYRVRTMSVPTRDGFALLTDHYVPQTDAPRGTVLIRSPYGRGFPQALTDARPLAGRGYHVLLQSCRGTHGSTGDLEPMVHEAADGADTVDWLATQDWYDGRLGTLGGSYLGHVQWALLDERPDAVRASVIAAGPHDFAAVLHGWGAFALGDFFGWSEMMTAPEGESGPRKLRRMAKAHERAAPALNGLPLLEAGREVLGDKALWYDEWLRHEELTDPFWDDYRHPVTTTAPTLLVGGWYDAFLDQTLEQHDAYTQAGVESRLVIGPWRHFDLPTRAAGEVMREALAWFDTHLAGEDPTEKSSVRVHVQGVGWSEHPELPHGGTERRLHLAADRLTHDPGAGVRSFGYDPADPTPSLGGRMVSPRESGPKRNAPLEGRSDVLVFTGDPLEAATTLLGRPGLELTLAVDVPHADVFARLCRVDRKGRSVNLSDAFVRLDPAVPAGEWQDITLVMDPVATLLAAGDRIRLQISGGAHPRFARNLGTAEPLSTGTTLRPQRHDVDLARCVLVLPVNDD